MRRSANVRLKRGDFATRQSKEAEMRRETEAAVQRRASRALEKLAVIFRRQVLMVPVAALAAGLSSSLQGSAPADVLPPAPAPVFLTLPLAGRAAILTLARACATAAGYAAAALENPAPASSAAASSGAVNISTPSGTLGGLRPLEFALAGPAGDWRTLITEAAHDLK
ncbi:MAG: hypothetical protein JWM59_3345 [Verrucomicrobiales bacterium]|nr:hypothetical protein [Verrucomicrobiales bacterium]